MVLGGLLEERGVDALFIEPDSPWENGYVESFNNRMHDELLDGELFSHIDEMKYVVERWQMDYNHHRPHSSLGFCDTGRACWTVSAGRIRQRSTEYRKNQACV